MSRLPSDVGIVHTKCSGYVAEQKQSDLFW